MKVIKIILVLAIIIFLFPKTYMSSPGFVTQEMNEGFELIKKECAGISILTNRAEMAADAPGKSLCFGWLYGGRIER